MAAAAADAASVEDALARALETDAACLWHNPAGALVVAAAACVAGDDAGAARRLPDPCGRPAGIVVQRGHLVEVGGGSLPQLLRLAGAVAVEVGTVDRCDPDELAAALRAPGAAAGLHVAVPRPVAGGGLVDLPSFAWRCREAGLPAVAALLGGGGGRGGVPAVVAALDAGAGLVVADGAALGGPPCGIVAGRADLVAACRLQARGIGRPMRAGPGDAALLAGALERSGRWRRRDGSSCTSSSAAS